MQKVILTPREIVFPEASTLDSSILEFYNEGIKSYEGKARNALDIFSNKKGELAGSNCFAPIKLREYLPRGARLATMADLGRATETNPQLLKDFFSDTGLVLRTAGDSYADNDFLAKDLANQLKKRNIDLKTPKIIYFDALNLRQDDKSNYGLSYDLNERAELEKNIIDAPELVRDFNFITMNERGVPIEDEKGSRTSYTRQDGLGRFYLDWDSDLNSFNDRLANSNEYGRVVVVSTVEGGAQEFFHQKLAELQTVRDAEIAQINERYSTAEKVLRGKN